MIKRYSEYRGANTTMGGLARECEDGEWIQYEDYIKEKDSNFVNPELDDGWHDCRKTLPDIIGDYLIHTEDKIAWAFYNSDGKWCGGNEFYKNVKAWMNLPKPPSFD